LPPGVREDQGEALRNNTSSAMFVAQSILTHFISTINTKLLAGVFELVLRIHSAFIFNIVC
jgi:hypothetical protein